VKITSQHLDLITRIYDTVLDAERWPEILAEIARVGNAKHTNVILHDSRNPEVTIAAASYDRAIFEEYHEKYMVSEEPMAINMLKYPAFQMVSDDELCNWGVDYSDMPVMPLLKREMGVKRRIVARLHDHGAWFDGLTFFYSQDRGLMTSAENKQAQILLPHVAKAIAVARPFNVLKSRFQAVFSVLDRFHIGVLVISSSGSVVIKNMEADRILDLKDGLSLTSNYQLRAQSDIGHSHLGAAIKAASATSQSAGESSGSLLSIERRSGEDAFLVEVAPLMDSQPEIGETLKGAFVFIIDPTNRARISTAGMEKLYELSKTESLVCKMLVDGHETLEMAEIRNVSPETIRTQLKSVFAKTRSSNRADVVRLALSVNLPIDQPDGHSPIGH